jgi:hypothetical protein
VLANTTSQRPGGETGARQQQHGDDRDLGNRDERVDDRSVPLARAVDGDCDRDSEALDPDVRGGQEPAAPDGRARRRTIDTSVMLSPELR